MRTIELDERKARFRSRECVLTPADQHVFCDMLRARYPTVIFCDVDVERQDLILYSSTVECRTDCSIWVVPEGWRPEFGYPREYNRRTGRASLINLPAMGLSFSQSLPREYLVSEISDHDLPGRPLDAKLTSFAGHGEIQGYHHDDEPEVKAFLTWVFNATRRLWTNRTTVTDLETNKIIDTFDGSLEWAGRDAAQRCENDPNFFIRVWPDRLCYGTLVGTKILPK